MLYIPYPFKRCTKCGNEFLPTQEFFYKRKTSDGDHPMLDARCKTCAKRQVANRYAKNPEPIKAYIKSYTAKNYDKVCADKRAYYQKNKRKMIEDGKKRRKQNPEPNRKAKRKYSRTEKGRLNIKNGKHKRRAAEGQFKPQDVIDQYDRQHHKCFWCSRPVDIHFHIDHIIPTSRYGTNWPANIVIACHSCNESKCDKLPFLEWQPPCCLGRQYPS